MSDKSRLLSISPPVANFRNAGKDEAACAADASRVIALTLCAFGRLFVVSPKFCNCCVLCLLQAKVDSIPIAPHPPQTQAASSLPPYRKRLGTRSPLRPESLPEAFPIKASDNPDVTPQPEWMGPAGNRPSMHVATNMGKSDGEIPRLRGGASRGTGRKKERAATPFGMTRFCCCRDGWKHQTVCPSIGHCPAHLKRRARHSACKARG